MELMNELEKEGIRIINFQKLTNEEGSFLENYFDEHIAPFLSPIIVSKQHPFPFLNNKQLYAVVLLSTSKGNSRMGIVPCMNNVFDRLIAIPTRPGTFMLSEELILHFISKLYSKYTVREKSILRITRSADIDTLSDNEEELDYRNVMEHLIRKRNRLEPVRVELSRPLDRDAVKELASYLGIHQKHIINVSTPLDLSFVFRLRDHLSDRPELFYSKRSPRLSSSYDPGSGMLAQIDKKDMLLSYPFESMKPFIRLLEEAAEDKSVVSIKITLYRVSSARSKIIEALIDAAENGKEVIVLIELRARFDEGNNIEISRRLQEAGCQILYGLGDYKVHSKLCLITRLDEEHKLSYITQIGTGNYNEKTSSIYTDLSLMTANYEIGRDAASVFAALQKGETIDKSSQLLVAPHILRNRLCELIDEQIALAKAGCRTDCSADANADGRADANANGRTDCSPTPCEVRLEAYIGLKLNSLTDKVLIEKLIEASQAGVKIDMIIRGICCLKPQVPGLTDNINVISIVGRFLEHSRIYIFGKGDSCKMYIASADFMTRNTIRRVEVAAPILDPDIRRRIGAMFELMLSDNAKGKLQDADGIYHDRPAYASMSDASVSDADDIIGSQELIKGSDSRNGRAFIDSQELLYEQAYAAAGESL